jgi:hypothetical protein
VVNLSLSKMEEWQAYKNSDNWINLSREKENEMATVDYMTSERGLNVLRASGIIPHPVMAVFRTICDGRYSAMYNTRIEANYQL